MHLVGFIIRIYHDARSSECQPQPCRPQTVKLFFLSLLQSWMMRSLFHCPLPTITPYFTPTNMGTSSEEIRDTITQALDFYNNLLNQTIKNLQKQKLGFVVPTAFV